MPGNPLPSNKTYMPPTLEATEYYKETHDSDYKLHEDDFTDVPLTPINKGKDKTRINRKRTNRFLKAITNKFRFKRTKSKKQQSSNDNELHEDNLQNATANLPKGSELLFGNAGTNPLEQLDTRASSTLEQQMQSPRANKDAPYVSPVQPATLQATQPNKNPLVSRYQTTTLSQPHAGPGPQTDHLLRSPSSSSIDLQSNAYKNTQFHRKPERANEDAGNPLVLPHRNTNPLEINAPQNYPLLQPDEPPRSPSSSSIDLQSGVGIEEQMQSPTASSSIDMQQTNPDGATTSTTPPKLGGAANKSGFTAAPTRKPVNNPLKLDKKNVNSNPLIGLNITGTTNDSEASLQAPSSLSMQSEPISDAASDDAFRSCTSEQSGYNTPLSGDEELEQLSRVESDASIGTPSGNSDHGSLSSQSPASTDSSTSSSTSSAISTESELPIQAHFREYCKQTDNYSSYTKTNPHDTAIPNALCQIKAQPHQNEFKYNSKTKGETNSTINIQDNQLATIEAMKMTVNLAEKCFNKENNKTNLFILNEQQNLFIEFLKFHSKTASEIDPPKVAAITIKNFGPRDLKTLLNKIDNDSGLQNSLANIRLRLPAQPEYKYVDKLEGTPNTIKEKTYNKITTKIDDINQKLQAIAKPDLTTSPRLGR
jgi:hypothetical protein